MRRRGQGLARASALACAFALVASSSAPAASGVPNRDADPVVLKGSDVPGLIAIQPSSLVAFSWDDGWKQIPVQVDERAVIDYPTVRQFNQTGNRPFTHEAYTDPGTFAGPDPDPTLDAGDEIAMMAKDAGSPADDEASPDGVDESTRTAVDISDPLDPAGARMIYLFKTNSGLDPAAGKSYVDYNFSLDSGDYKTTYDFITTDDSGSGVGGPPHNPENSLVTTSFYSQHLLARWIADRIQISAGNATEVDILDGDKAQVGRGCGRSDVTFSRGGGGFITNKSGPVRAIRSYIGANSGTYTQRDDIYYQRRQDTFTYLRVHEGISQISQYLDFSANAVGMTYRNSVYPTGVTIDGVPDAAIPGSGGQSALQPATTWEQTTGPQGSLTVTNRVDTNTPGFAPGSFYRDEGTTGLDFSQCAGYADNASYGSSGSEFKSQGKNTDPTLDSNPYTYPHYDLTGKRSIFYDAPFTNATTATDTAELRSSQIDSPLVATANGEAEPEAPVLKLAVKGPDGPVKPGRLATFDVKVVNSGGPASNLEICPKGPKRFVDVGGCKDSQGRVPRIILKSFRVGVSDTAKHPIKIRFKATADNAKPAKASARIKIQRRG